ncbi:MAG TPA: SlyX family protein [Phycisphaerae bacterium]|nr:SlyX family protein [Phycisphaerae bacterium]
MDDRIIQLQEKIAFLEQTVAKLDRTVWDLNQKFAAGQEELARLRGQLEAMLLVSGHEHEEPEPPT